VVDVRDDGNVADVRARLEHRGAQGSEPAGRSRIFMNNPG
jgi:hypothetical protein